MTIGQHIKSIRKRQGIKAIDLAQMAGISQGYMSKIERDKCLNLTLDTLAKIANALGISVVKLVSDKDHDKNQNH